MPKNLPAKFGSEEITWKQARAIFVGTLGGGSTLVGVFTLLQLLLGRMQVPAFIIFVVGAGVIVYGRYRSFWSRVRLIVAVEAGMAIPFAVARHFGLVHGVVELMTHLLFLTVVPLVWFVMGLRSAGGLHPWTPTLSGRGRPGRSGYRD